MNLTLPLVREALRGEDGGARCYIYVVDSFKVTDGSFRQTGSGPNFQGGVITLCTCKRRMKSAGAVDDWPGRWIAGFTGRNRSLGRPHYLAFLMKVAKATASHKELWVSNALPSKTKLAKAAHLHYCGDVYQPRTGPGDPFKPTSYLAPAPGAHSHRKSVNDIEWREDITSGGALLIGANRLSFLWNERRMQWPFDIPRHFTHRYTVQQMLDQLQPAGQ